MAKARAIIKRRKAVQNIRKITRTMQLIATARFQRSHQRAVRAKPYTAGVTDLSQELAALSGPIRHPLLQTHSDANKASVVILTSNRGLCGGYNGNVLRTALELVEQHQQAGRTMDLHVAGKKGINYVRFLRQPIRNTYTEFEGWPRYAAVEPIAQQLMDQYVDGQIDRVDVVYTRFLATSSQRPEVLQLLPIPHGPAGDRKPELPGPPLEPPVPAEHYDFSPGLEQLVSELLPVTVKVRLYQCFMDAAVSEQVARMVAMKAATDASEDMIKYLTRRYNRARQTQITLELLDIMGGTEALR